MGESESEFKSNIVDCVVSQFKNRQSSFSWSFGTHIIETILSFYAQCDDVIIITLSRIVIEALDIQNLLLLEKEKKSCIQ